MRKKTERFIPTAKDVAALKRQRAILLYAESSMNMVTLVSVYAAQSAVAEMHGAFAHDERLYRFRVKKLVCEARKKIDMTVKGIISRRKHGEQREYLFVYSDALDDEMRPVINELFSVSKKFLEERGCPHATACAWTLSARAVTLEACNVFNSVIRELSEMFGTDLRKRYLCYYIQPCLDSLDVLLTELEKQCQQVAGIDLHTLDKTIPSIEKIDDTIRNSKVLLKAADDAEKCLDEKEAEERKKFTAEIMGYISNEVNEHLKKIGETGN